MSLALVLGLAVPFTATEMMKLRRLADPQASPDGRAVAYALTEIDAAGARNSDIWIVPTAGGEPRRLTSHPKTDARPRWSPDGKRLAFVSTREGPAQVFVLDLAGGEPRPVTSLATAVSSFLWADDRTLIVASEVHPDCPDQACNEKRKMEAGGPRVYDRLLFRHWDTWEDGRRTHLLAVPPDGGAPLDLTPGDRDAPPFSLGGEDFAVSPDGKEVCFSRIDDPLEAASTDADLFVVPTGGGAARKVADSPGYDGGCSYSPDGTRIAFRAQMRAGYESDRWRLMVVDRRTGVVANLTESLDRHVEELAWSADSGTISFVVPEAGRSALYAVAASGGTPRRLASGGTFQALQALPGGNGLLATEATFTRPAEVVRFDADGSGKTPVTSVNDALLGGFGLRSGESVSYTGAAGKSVQAWVVKPPDFDPVRRYPLLVLVHGGPQGAWEDGWTYRWNAQVFASAGYVVFLPNPRASSGFGQEFMDDINADWGGRAYEDVLKGTDFAEALPYVEKGRTAAAGASYGGYLINWIAGHTDRYRALVSHDGLYDLASFYGATEELWFPEWELRGTPWDNPDMYARWSPSRFAKAFKTPTLVIHGELDYRVPLEQGLQMFTALQRRGIPSRLVVFPDENHWVLKPVNSVRWYAEVLGWLDRWTGK